MTASLGKNEELSNNLAAAGRAGVDCFPAGVDWGPGAGRDRQGAAHHHQQRDSSSPTFRPFSKPPHCSQQRRSSLVGHQFFSQSSLVKTDSQFTSAYEIYYLCHEFYKDTEGNVIFCLTHFLIMDVRVDSMK